MATWDLQASAGATGKSILWRGEYNPAVTYNPYDSVSYQGSSYICTEITIGVAPIPSTTSYPPPLATTGSRGSIAALPASNQDQYFARGDNTWQLAKLPPGAIYGLNTANGTDAVNDINIAVGVCSDSTGTADIRLASPLVKQLDAAWAAGTDAGGRDTGAIADAWWHVFAIKNPTTGVADVLFSQSATAPTLPSGYTVFRRTGSVLRAAGVLMTFLQLGDCFYQALNTVYASGTVRSLSLFTMTRCPLGVITFPILHLSMACNTNSAGRFSLSSGLNSAFVATYSRQDLANAIGNVPVTCVSTNFAQQIYMGTTLPSPPTLCQIDLNGYYDNRGKDGYSP